MGGFSLIFLADAAYKQIDSSLPHPGRAVELRISESEQRQLRIALETLLAPPSEATDMQWQTDVVTAIAHFTRANTGAVRTTDGNSAHMTPVGVDPAIVKPYLEYYQQFDYGRALGGSQATGQLFSRNNFYGENLPAFRKSEYYTDYLSKHNLLDAMCLSTRAERHDRGSVLYLWYDKDLTSFNRERVVAFLRLIAPVFQAGMTARRDLLGRHRQILANIDNCTDGCALFTKSGKLVHRNPRFDAALAACRDQRLILEEIGRQVNDTSRLAFHSGGAGVFLPRSLADLTIAGSVYRVSTSIIDSSQPESFPSILVSVSRVGQGASRHETGEEICRRFGLTKRETEVALLLNERLTNREIAAQLGLSEHTTRHHTESIMLKLQVPSRADIRKKIASVTGG